MFSSAKPAAASTTTILTLPGGDYHYFADAGGIFEEAFINSLVDEIREYNATRQLEQKSAAFGENDFRALPDLAKYLYAAYSAEHCAFILVYLWNMTADHHTVEFQAMVDGLRFKISQMMMENEKIRASFNTFLLGFKNICTVNSLPSCYLDSITICDLTDKSEEMKRQRQRVEILSILSTFLKEPPITRRHVAINSDRGDSALSPYISHMMERFTKSREPATDKSLASTATFWSRLSSSGKPAPETQATAGYLKNTIFTRDFIAKCERDTLPHHKSIFVFLRGRSTTEHPLPQLAAYLERASSPEHIAFIMLYVWNQSTNGTDEFKAMADALRVKISNVALSRSSEGANLYKLLIAKVAEQDLRLELILNPLGDASEQQFKSIVSVGASELEILIDFSAKQDVPALTQEQRIKFQIASTAAPDWMQESFQDPCASLAEQAATVTPADPANTYEV